MDHPEEKYDMYMIYTTHTKSIKKSWYNSEYMTICRHNQINTCLNCLDHEISEDTPL